MSVSISVVIPTRNRPEFLRRCLSALRRELQSPGSREIVVVDDGSSPSEAHANSTLCGQMNARYLPHDKNHGMAVARNTGWRATSGSWTVFIDDDVQVETGWHQALLTTLTRHNRSREVIGVEFQVNGSGPGLWDREVQSLRAGLFLSCHIAYRREVLQRLGGFDEHFEHQGPYCEDHELAARALKLGSIPFESTVSATHMPRRMRYSRYLKLAPRRMRQMLRAEYYFYHKHRDRYHMFRRHASFWGTYAAILTRHAVTEIRRRAASRLLARSWEVPILLVGALIEQVTAWTMAPHFAFEQLWARNPQGLPDAVDWERTRALWQLSADAPASAMTLQPSLVRAVTFRLTRWPVYDARTTLARLRPHLPSGTPRVYLRIDDVFLECPTDVTELCDVCAHHHTPFLAAIPGADFTRSDARGSLRAITDCGGIIGLHGFAHDGRFGPFASEVLQMGVAELDAAVDKVLSILGSGDFRPRVFVPPFNAVAWDQVQQLSRRFDVVCGGPETARFARGAFGPIAVGRGSWYFPSVQPFYSTARALRRSAAFKALATTGAIVCVTLHMPEEAADGYSALSALLDEIGPLIHPWSELLAGGRLA